MNSDVVMIDMPFVRVSTYGGALFSDVSLRLNYGKTYCLVGPSGSGKTTLMRAIARQRSVRMTYFAPRERITAERMTVSELARAVRGHDAIRRWLGSIEPNQACDSLSLGEKTRLALAIADHMEPVGLLLDEPSVGLDKEGQALLDDLLQRRRSRRTVTMVSTHDLTAFDSDRCEMIVLRQGTDGVRSLDATSRMLRGTAVLSFDGAPPETIAGTAAAMARHLLTLQAHS